MYFDPRRFPLQRANYPAKYRSFHVVIGIALLIVFIN